MSIQRLLTLHAPMARALALPVVRCVEEKLKDRPNIGHVWLSADDLPDVVVMADVHDDEGELPDERHADLQ